MNVFDLFAKISLDKSEYDKGLNDAEKSGESFGGKIAKGLGTATKAIGAGITVAATGVAALTKSSVAAYADFEQLTGGIETLFKTSADEVMKYADEAYKTAGLSANEYMETVTSFSAALISSLGGDTEMAAKMADMAITDMSDNANKMGSSMESIQNAYQGFAKQNYTMLDNLKLGYGGTKEEMQRLLDDAEKLSGIKYDLSSYADIVDAIHVVQTEMGITGTTAKEAEKTISGSIGMMKASWKNMVTALSDPQGDYSAAMDNLVKSTETAFNNILPAVENALGGIAKLIEGIAPVIAEKLPGLIQQVLPPLLSAATTIINALVDNLPTILQVLIDQASMIIDSIINAIVALIPQIIPLGFQILMALADGIVNSLDTLIPAITDVIFQIVDILTEPDNILKLLDAALKIIVAIADGLMQALPKLIEKVPQIITKLVDAIVKALPKIVEAGLKILTSIIDGILKGLPKIPGAVQQIKSAVTDGILKIVNSADEWGRDLIMNFINGIRQKFNDFKAELTNMASTVKNYIGFSEPKLGPLSNFHTYAPDMMELFAKGIRDNEHLITDQLNKSFDFGSSIAGSGMSSSVANNSNVVINVYGAEGQNINELAEIISDKINNATKRQAYAWGGV